MEDGFDTGEERVPGGEGGEEEDARCVAQPVDAAGGAEQDPEPGGEGDAGEDVRFEAEEVLWGGRRGVWGEWEWSRGWRGSDQVQVWVGVREGIGHGQVQPSPTTRTTTTLPRTLGVKPYTPGGGLGRGR